VELLSPRLLQKIERLRKQAFFYLDIFFIYFKRSRKLFIIVFKKILNFKSKLVILAYES